MFNRYIVVPLIVWAIAQFLKFIIAAARGHLDIKYLYASGGMPSVHSAVVTALATTAYLVDGASSAAFGLSVVLAAIVMYDSFGVRRSAGEQAMAINKIFDHLEQNSRMLERPHLRELLGHNPLEVSSGAVLGLVLALILNYDKIGGLIATLTWQLPRLAIIIIAALAALAIVAGYVIRVMALKKYRRIEIIEQAVRRGYLSVAAIAAVALALMFLAYERVEVAAWVVWIVLVALIKVVDIIWFWLYYRQRVATALADNVAIIEKQRWFEGPNKKRRAKAARSKKRK